MHVEITQAMPAMVLPCVDEILFRSLWGRLLAANNRWFYSRLKPPLHTYKHSLAVFLCWFSPAWPAPAKIPDFTTLVLFQGDNVGFSATGKLSCTNSRRFRRHRCGAPQERPKGWSVWLKDRTMASLVLISSGQISHSSPKAPTFGAAIIVIPACAGMTVFQVSQDSVSTLQHPAFAWRKSSAVR